MRRLAVLLAGVVLLAFGALLQLRRTVDEAHPPEKGPGPTSPKGGEFPRSEPGPGLPPGISRGPSVASERTFRSILLKHRERTGGRLRPGPGYATRFQIESEYGFTEARLLALADPDLTERLARATATDPSSPSDDVLMAVYMLRIVAQQGREGAKQFLHELASQADTERSRYALAALGEVDVQGTYRSLFWKKCEEGVLEAFGPVGNWPDPASITLLERLRDSGYKKPAPWNTCSRLASESLGKLRILTTSDRAALDKLLTDPVDNLHTPWAIQAARQLSYQNLLETLRARLDAGLKAGMESDSWALTNPTDGHLGSIPDYDFDEVLISYSEMGGKLSPWEQQRLRYFGYACDPATRLHELVDKWR